MTKRKTIETITEYDKDGKVTRTTVTETTEEETYPYNGGSITWNGPYHEPYYNFLSTYNNSDSTATNAAPSKMNEVLCRCHDKATTCDSASEAVSLS